MDNKITKLKEGLYNLRGNLFDLTEMQTEFEKNTSELFDNSKNKFCSLINFDEFNEYNFENYLEWEDFKEFCYDNNFLIAISDEHGSYSYFLNKIKIEENGCKTLCFWDNEQGELCKIDEFGIEDKITMIKFFIKWSETYLQND